MQSSGCELFQYIRKKYCLRHLALLPDFSRTACAVEMPVFPEALSRLITSVITGTGGGLVNIWETVGYCISKDTGQAIKT